ncbi:putative extracellular scp domain-containing protein pry1 protein [Botrytis fragariae]|uniref:Putative extracellular scp domain-containing protein pry1 protein n=1 Tax=Botrytis fragariae TaxID=1964551 RepID=A0A8H6AWL4_9HELO|nr:putative extracellular scp domain-containing protein pry1 protein [Botrytis fragariae]KAF5874820.1 putative extracellular scp domain-containing protein pry1 protein [Botrytis fragariae]
MFLSCWAPFLLLLGCAIGQINIETLVPETLVTLSSSDDTPTPTAIQTLVSLLVDTFTAPSSPSKTELPFPSSLTQTSRSLSQNDSQATSAASSPNKIQTSVPPLSTQASPKETGFNTPGQFKIQILNAQNWYRAAHGALPLVWNDTLANSSSGWVAGCVWDLESTPGIGKSFVSAIPTSVFGIVNYLGLERQFYNWSEPGPTNSTKQFTQMVWKSTTSVGCAWNNCPPGSSPDPATPGVSLFLLCQYYPKGNQGTITDWKDNVGELESGSLGEGVVAADGFGLSSLTTAITASGGTSGNSAASTISSLSTAATGKDVESLANKLGTSRFAMVISSAIVIGSLAWHPLALVPLFLAVGFADAKPGLDVSALLKKTVDMESVSRVTNTQTA